DDGELYQVMKQAAKLGAVVTVRAENGDAVAALQKELIAAGMVGPEYHPVSRPSAVEGEATERALVMAALHGTRAYIVHMTCKESVQALERAKLRGQKCYGETCPQYLLLDDTVFTKPSFEGAAYVMRRPIRPPLLGHHDALWTGLSTGMLDSVGTDHCPFTMEQKRAGKANFTLIPNGAAGIEDRLSLLYTYGVCAGHFDVQRMVALGSTNPARIFGLYPRKGTVAVGGDADLVLYDPSGESVRSAKTHHSKCDRNIFEGFKVKGKVTCVVVNGRVQFRDGALDVQRGAGRFIKREVTHAAARQVSHRNLDAIRHRDREAYLACYLHRESLARTGPTGFTLGYASVESTRSSSWPDHFEALDLRLTPIGPGVVYGTYRYRVRYGAEEQSGLSERVFIATPEGWRIAVSTAFQGLPGVPPPPRAIVGATLVDGRGGPPIRDAVVVLRDGRIECAGPRSAC